MSGTVTVIRRDDRTPPYLVQVVRDHVGPVPEEHACRTPAEAQTAAVEVADAEGLTLVYRIAVRDSEACTSVEAAEASNEPRRLTVEEFQAVMKRPCSKCREAKPLTNYRMEFHVNRATNPGRRVMHGYADMCLSCEEAKA